MKILMVCLGNICRSPLAHGIMDALAHQHTLDWEIDSAGTGGWHVGEPPDRRSIAIARQYGVDISGQRCRQFSARDFDRYDLILVMDRSNLEDVLAQARTESDRSKVRLLCHNDIVPDPYYDDSQFDPVYRLIDEACRTIIEDHKKPDPFA